MRQRANREREWFWERVGLLRKAMLLVVVVAILSIVGLMLYGFAASATR